MKMSNSEKTANIVIYLIMFVMVLVVLYPMWYILIASFSGAAEVSAGNVILKVHDFNMGAYKRVFAMNGIAKAYFNTIFYTVFGTLLSISLTILGGYALSKSRLYGRRGLLLFITFTMWFNAGMMPTYLTYQTLNLVNTRMGILLCGAVSTFYVIIMRTCFEAIPDSMEESAKLDGANDFQILCSVYLPLAKPTIMTLVLYYMVSRWNGYFWSMILLKDDNLIPLQVVLKKLIVTMSGLYDNGSTNADTTQTSAETVVYATIVIAAAPMLLVYPFIQRFFAKGIMVGAVKG
ncbi:MAG: carbohydrate ABC transporter permease [Clostridia bacterium]|nr:carbohydrate ABC transporter permease [Clostridia bacterium]